MVSIVNWFWNHSWSSSSLELSIAVQCFLNSKGKKKTHWIPSQACGYDTNIFWITTITISIIKPMSPNTTAAIFRFFATLEESWAFPASPRVLAVSAYNNTNINNKKNADYKCVNFSYWYLFFKQIVSDLLCMSRW